MEEAMDDYPPKDGLDQWVKKLEEDFLSNWRIWVEDLQKTHEEDGF